jgi:hypothetical protein
MRDSRRQVAKSLSGDGKHFIPRRNKRKLMRQLLAMRKSSALSLYSVN